MSQEQHCDSSNLKNTERSLVFTFLDKLLFTIPVSLKDSYPEEDRSYCKQSSHKGRLGRRAESRVDVLRLRMGPAEQGRIFDDGRRARAVELQLVLPLELGADGQALGLGTPLLQRRVVVGGVELGRQRDELAGPVPLSRGRGRPGRHFEQPSLGSSAQPRRAGPP